MSFEGREKKRARARASERAKKEAQKKKTATSNSQWPLPARRRHPPAKSTLRSFFIPKNRPLNNSHSRSIKYQDVWQMYKKSEVRLWGLMERRKAQKERGEEGKRESKRE